jgi:hypothetical protein
MRFRAHTCTLAREEGPVTPFRRVILRFAEDFFPPEGFFGFRTLTVRAGCLFFV